MSKYTEIREVLKEDIAEIVELTLKNRLESIIPALMPAIIDFISDNIKVHTTSNCARKEHVHINMEWEDANGFYHIRPLYSGIHLKADQITGEIDHLIMAHNYLDKQLQTLSEHANTHTEAAP